MYTFLCSYEELSKQKCCVKKGQQGIKTATTAAAAASSTNKYIQRCDLTKLINWVNWCKDKYSPAQHMGKWFAFMFQKHKGKMWIEEKIHIIHTLRSQNESIDKEHSTYIRMPWGEFFFVHNNNKMCEREEWNNRRLRMRMMRMKNGKKCIILKCIITIFIYLYFVFCVHGAHDARTSHA